MSQIREDVEDSDYRVGGWVAGNAEVVLQDGGKYELWRKNNVTTKKPVIIIGENAYVFVREALPGDLWWAGITTDTDNEEE